ncbi:hypothetical protein Tco_1142471 [Tanacetum coccineum]
MGDLQEEDFAVNHEDLRSRKSTHSKRLKNAVWAKTGTKGVMSMMGQMSFFLGLQVSQSPGGIFINQAKYALETLKKYGWTLVTRRSTDGGSIETNEDLMGIPVTNLDQRNVGSPYEPHSQTINHGSFGIRKTTPFTNPYAMRIMRDVKIQEENTMAEQNVPAQPPTRTDEQIISVDILSNTNFFQAFTASANVPAIYLQQFWKTMSYNEKTGVYSCQVDEQWFDLSADLLRKALAITPVNPTHPFELPPSGDTVIDFVNELGYPEPVEIVSSIRVNYVYQPWRAILSLLNQCLTGKTSGSDKPRHPVLQMMCGIVTQTNV